MRLGNTEWFRNPPPSFARNVRRFEYGKPAVVGTHDGTTGIKDGSYITVDGGKGIVVTSGKGDSLQGVSFF